MVKDKAGYTPWKGRTVKGWPTTVLLRGEVLVADGKLKAKPGSGQFLPRKGGWAAEPLGRATQEFDPKRNFGAKLR
jgi:dihydropyrimidinase